MRDKEGKYGNESKNDKNPKRELDLHPSVSDALKSLKGKQEIYEDDTIKKVTSLCMKYLQDEKEVHRRDLKMSIYLKFLDDPSGNVIREILKQNENLTEKEMWKISESALDIIEENTDLLEIEREDENQIYRWKK